ncbi:MAG: 2-oxo acid dehydrogenase subunit E2, partial [Planctomycetes bacterium]|nr:2-oxo acid dehydrogenase subunit E2 [Planctomycetota bacterium]
MTTPIKLPSLGENIQSGDVLTIFVSVGEMVQRDQDLLEVETDKATMPIPSPEAGKIIKILVSEGDTVAIGAPIMEIEAAASEEKSVQKKAPPHPKKAGGPPPAVEQAGAEEAEQAVPSQIPPAKRAAKQSAVKKMVDEEPEETSPVRAKSRKSTADGDLPEDDLPGDGHVASAAGPAVRRLARQLGVELRRIRPTGAGGRVTAEDVRAYVRATNEQVAAVSPKGVTPPGSADTDEYGAVRIERMSRLRQTIAKNMLQSVTTVPQLTNFDDVDVTELEDMRQQSKEDYATRGIKLTTMPFLIKAVASSLKRHPIVNASVDMESNQIIYKEYVHIGMAVDTEKGLIVPVLRDVDRKSISQIAGELDEMAENVRAGRFAIEDLRGGTFTISNLGSVGGSYSTPIINPPQVAILLTGRSRMMPMIVDDQIVPRLVMPLSITYDHRAV